MRHIYVSAFLFQTVSISMLLRYSHHQIFVFIGKFAYCSIYLQSIIFIWKFEFLIESTQNHFLEITDLIGRLFVDYKILIVNFGLTTFFRNSSQGREYVAKLLEIAFCQYLAQL